MKQNQKKSISKKGSAEADIQKPAKQTAENKRSEVRQTHIYIQQGGKGTVGLQSLAFTLNEITR